MIYSLDTKFWVNRFFLVFFSFWHVKVLFLCIVSYIVCNETLTAICIAIVLYVMSLFPECFLHFFLFFGFQQFDYSVPRFSFLCIIPLEGYCVSRIPFLDLWDIFQN